MWTAEEDEMLQEVVENCQVGSRISWNQGMCYSLVWEGGGSRRRDVTWGGRELPGGIQSLLKPRYVLFLSVLKGVDPEEDEMLQEVVENCQVGSRISWNQGMCYSLVWEGGGDPEDEMLQEVVENCQVGSRISWNQGMCYFLVFWRGGGGSRRRQGVTGGGRELPGGIQNLLEPCYSLVWERDLRTLYNDDNRN